MYIEKMFIIVEEKTYIVQMKKEKWRVNEAPTSAFFENEETKKRILRKKGFFINNFYVGYGSEKMMIIAKLASRIHAPFIAGYIAKISRKIKQSEDKSVETLEKILNETQLR